MFRTICAKFSCLCFLGIRVVLAAGSYATCPSPTIAHKDFDRLFAQYGPAIKAAPCSLIGSIQTPSNQSCSHPLSLHLRNYENALAEEEVIVGTNSSLRLSKLPASQKATLELARYNLTLALCTYDRFSRIQPVQKDAPRLDYASFLHLRKVPVEVTDPPWWAKALMAVDNFLNQYVWEPVKKLLWLPLKTLAPNLKIGIYSAGAILLFLILFYLAKLTTKVQPLLPASAQTRKELALAAENEIYHGRTILSLYQSGQYRESLEKLYSWLVLWTDKGLHVNRQEWWTNGQLIAIAEARFPERAQVIIEIIKAYESVIFGHSPLEPAVLAALLQKSPLPVLSQGRSL